jgi:hypothetical protein
MNTYDDDEPPQLVDVGTELDASDEVDKVGDNLKVPLTIVTGRNSKTANGHGTKYLQDIWVPVKRH